VNPKIQRTKPVIDWFVKNSSFLNERVMSSKEIYSRLSDNAGTGKDGSGFGEFEQAEGTPQELEAEADEWKMHVTQAATARAWLAICRRASSG
jgi:hypothetical protein